MSVQLRNPELVRLLAADFVTRREVVATAGNRLTLTNSSLTVSGGGDVTLSAAANTTLTLAESGTIALTDGITAPGATAGIAKLYVDTADGDLKVKFGDGTVKTIATDT